MKNKQIQLVPANYLTFPNPEKWIDREVRILYEELIEEYIRNKKQPFLLNIDDLFRKLNIRKSKIIKLIRWYALLGNIKVVRQTINYNGKQTTSTYIGFSYIELNLIEKNKFSGAINHGVDIKPVRVI